LARDIFTASTAPTRFKSLANLELNLEPIRDIILYGIPKTTKEEENIYYGIRGVDTE